MRLLLFPDAFRSTGPCLSWVGSNFQSIAMIRIWRMDLTVGSDSRYYLHQEQVPVLEIALKRPCRIVTTGEFLRAGSVFPPAFFDPGRGSRHSLLRDGSPFIA